MKKIGAITVVLVLGIVAFLIVLLTMPTITDIANTANQSMAATSNMSNYPGTAGLMVSAPWILLFAIPVIVIALEVVILKTM